MFSIRMWVLICFLFPSIVLTAADVQDDNRPFVRTAKGGKIIGNRVDFGPYQLPDVRRSATVYKGIPYARAPSDDLRFSPPVAAPAIEGELDTTLWRPVACLQPRAMLMRELHGDELMSEDCLYLDVFVPDPESISSSGPRPVMVWIHGGGYLFGMGTSEKLQPIGLAVLGDVIVVTFNYRLGPLGFLTTGDDEIPANLGLLDQRQALLWVRDNIADFGGDPERVTIFGESAGGSAINLHLLSPLSHGLFHRAIMQSGVLNKMFSHIEILDDAVGLAREFGQAVGCESAESKQLAACLRKKSWDEFEPVLHEMILTGGSFSFLPAPDGRMLPTADLYKVAAKSQYSRAVPIMTGSLSNEGDLMILGPELFYPDKMPPSEPPSFNRKEFWESLAASLRVNDPLILRMTSFVFSNASNVNNFGTRTVLPGSYPLIV